MADETRFYYRDPGAPTPNAPRRFGTMALIERDGSLLLERRADAPVWSMIGGDLGDDETLVESLQREVREETGLRVAGYQLFGGGAACAFRRGRARSIVLVRPTDKEGRE